MKFFKSKFFIFCLIAAIVLALVPTLLAAFGRTDILRSALTTVAKPFNMCASGVANAFNGFVNVFTQYDDLKAENEELRNKLQKLEKEKYDSKLLADQNSWLKDYINLHDQHPEFTLKDAKVISREANNYSIVLTLNKGSAHGVKRNMPVLTEDGLLGYISEVGLDWCRVSTVIEATSSIGVYTDIGGVLGVLSGSAELHSQGLCKMEYIESNSSIGLGYKVYTSGTSTGIYPSGLLVGSISDIEIDEVTGERVALITPAVDFTDINSISNVMIISGIDAAKGDK